MLRAMPTLMHTTHITAVESPSKTGLEGSERVVGRWLPKAKGLLGGKGRDDAWFVLYLRCVVLVSGRGRGRGAWGTGRGTGRGLGGDATGGLDTTTPHQHHSTRQHEKLARESGRRGLCLWYSGLGCADLSCAVVALGSGAGGATRAWAAWSLR